MVVWTFLLIFRLATDQSTLRYEHPIRIALILSWIHKYYQHLSTWMMRRCFKWTTLDSSPGVNINSGTQIDQADDFKTGWNACPEFHWQLHPIYSIFKWLVLSLRVSIIYIQYTSLVLTMYIFKRICNLIIEICVWMSNQCYIFRILLLVKSTVLREIILMYL